MTTGRCERCSVKRVVLYRHRDWECSKIDCPERRPLTANGDEHQLTLNLEDEDADGKRTPD